MKSIDSFYKPALTLLFVFAMQGIAFSQPASGLYLTAADFVNGKLSYTSAEKCHARIRGASATRKVKIKCGGSVKFISKDSVYGYVDKSSRIFRFYRGQPYQLLNPGEEIQLYQVQLPGHSKYELSVMAYYFSRNALEDLQPLTISNLLRSFRENTKMTEIIEMRYRYDEELMEYDSFHKKYKLNYFLELSRK